MEKGVPKSMTGMYQPSRRAPFRGLILDPGQVVPDKHGSQAQREAWMRQHQFEKALEPKLRPIKKPLPPMTSAAGVKRHPNSVVTVLAQQAAPGIQKRWLKIVWGKE